MLLKKKKINKWEDGINLQLNSDQYNGLGKKVLILKNS